ncbi:hypothetical protein [Ideonella sp.]|uniref:hypothetical protein n=1 Tax=Ideonella sp. TaxID=1929293 RepID=UPI002B4753AC|nr:hypothetical protein [Ideonella sp.]HJV70670.1 hypothetical protein [Ideonella sp.]
MHVPPNLPLRADGRAHAWAASLVLALASASSPAVSPDAVQRCGAEPACLARLEATALRDSAGTARRDGRQLVLQFGLHPPSSFVDQPPVTHLYLGRLDGVLLHVVRAAQTGQPSRWWLVGESGQAPLVVDALPVAAPGGRQFVVTSGNSLSLYQRSGPRWSLQYRFDAAPGLVWGVKGWRADAAAVRLEWLWPEAPAACAGQAAQGQLQLRDGPYGWDLVPEAPRRCAP